MDWFGLSQGRPTPSLRPLSRVGRSRRYVLTLLRVQERTGQSVATEYLEPCWTVGAWASYDGLGEQTFVQLDSFDFPLFPSILSPSTGIRNGLLGNIGALCAGLPLGAMACFQSESEDSVCQKGSSKPNSASSVKQHGVTGTPSSTAVARIQRTASSGHCPPRNPTFSAHRSQDVGRETFPVPFQYPKLHKAFAQPRIASAPLLSV